MAFNVQKIIDSKVLYYAAMILMIVNVLGYVSQGSIECILVFALSYYILSSKSGIPKKYAKLPSLSIFGGLFVSNVIFGCGKVKEGMEEKKVGKVEGVLTEDEAAAAAKKKTDELKQGCEDKDGEWDDKRHSCSFPQV